MKIERGAALSGPETSIRRPDFLVPGKAIQMSKLIHVLLVDDEELFVRNLSLILAKRGMVVRWANDGATALELVSSTERCFFDVVVLDLRMPGLDGLATLKAIRELDPRIPVILLTGHADITQVSNALKEGVNEVLLKPCPIETLVSTIENVHESRVIEGELS
jgi:DNA-binding NtrC family response regulator